MPNTLDILLPILFLAFLCEGLVEYLAKPLFRPRKLLELGDEDDGSDNGQGLPIDPTVETDSAPDPDYNPLILRYVAAAVGILLAIAYRADLLAMVGLSNGWPYLGYIITGIVIGRGSNYMNDLADRWLAPNRQPQSRSDC